MDGLTLGAFLQEARPLVQGARIAESRLLGPYTLCLSLRRRGERRRWLSCATGEKGAGLVLSPDPPTHAGASGPMAPWIKGAEVVSLTQEGMNSICSIALRPAHQRVTCLTLTVTLAGRRGSIALKADQRAEPILSLGASAPTSRKQEPTSLTSVEALARALAEPRPADLPVGLLLARRLAGLDPLLAQELATRAGCHPSAPLEPAMLPRIWKALAELREIWETGAFSPHLLLDEAGGPAGVVAIPLHSWPPARQVALPSILEGLNRYGAWGGAAGVAELRKRMEKARSRLMRRRTKIAGDLVEAERAEEFRKMGELLRVYGTRLSRGLSEATLPDYYQGPDARITIPLDPTRTIQANAEGYFKRFRKAIRGRDHATRRLAATDRDLARLDALADRLASATGPEELAALEGEVGLLSSLPGSAGPAQRAGTSRRRDPLAPHRFRSSDGHEILVGRSTQGNAYLTWRLGQPHDLWLHVQGRAGAHVIVRAKRDEQIPARTLREAAQLAAYYSKARSETKVPVDYTRVKFLRRPRGGKPGTALITQEKTILVRPDAALVGRLALPPETR